MNVRAAIAEFYGLETEQVMVGNGSDEVMLMMALAFIKPGERVQFERMGYFFADLKDSQPGQPVFNRIVTLRDTWGKIERKG